MNKTFLKLLELGGVGYLVYKYYYIPYQLRKNKENEVDNVRNLNDGRTTYYGENKTDYVRGFPLPAKITDIKENKIWVISKPDKYVFGQNPRGMFQVNLSKDVNRIIYSPTNKEEFILDYNIAKDKLVMSNDYTK